MPPVDRSHTLAPEELPELRKWLRLQYTMGVDRSSEPYPWQRYFAAVLYYGNGRKNFINYSIKWMTDNLYIDLGDTADSGKMAITYLYYNFLTQTSTEALVGKPQKWPPSENYWCKFINKSGLYIPPASLHPSIPEFDGKIKKEMVRILNDWGEYPPHTDIMVCDNHFDREQAAKFAEAVLDKWWSTNNNSTVLFSKFLAAQRLKTTDLIVDGLPFPAGIYFYILHLLIGLCTIKKEDQLLALKIITITTTSEENPGDTFIDHLIYISMMYLADPIGSFRLNHTQIIQLLNDTIACITGKDESSKAIIKSIKHHLSIIEANPSYPMQDPKNPEIGFNTRYADTLSALDDARVRLRPYMR